MNTLIVVVAFNCLALFGEASFARVGHYPGSGYYPGAGHYALTGYYPGLGYYPGDGHYPGLGYYPLAGHYSGSGYYPGAGFYAHSGGHYGGYRGPLATPVVLPSGYLADTPEVAAAKGAHLTAVAHAKTTSGAGYYGAGYAGAYGRGYGHHGPFALPVVLPSGYLADEPAVAATKAAHLIAVAHATKRAAGYAYGHAYGYGNVGYYHA